MNPTNLNDTHDTTESLEGHAVGQGTRPRRTETHERQRRNFDLGRWLEVGRNLSAQVEEQVHKRPFAILGATVGLGFAAGSLLGSRLGQWMVAAGIGYAMRNATGGTPAVERIRAGLEKLAGEPDVD